jgi:hypothetical protein
MYFGNAILEADCSQFRELAVPHQTAPSPAASLVNHSDYPRMLSS